MEINSITNEILSRNTDIIYEKMDRLLNKNIGSHTLVAYRYYRDSSKLILDLSGSSRGDFTFAGDVDLRMFHNSDFVLANYLSLRIESALARSA